MRRSIVGIAVGAALALAACGEDSGGAKAKPVTDAQTLETGRAAAQASSGLSAIQVDTDAQGAKGPVNSVGTALHTLVNQYRVTKLQQQQQGFGLAAQALEVARQAQDAEITDTVTFENDHLSASLNYEDSQTTVRYHVELDILPQDGGGWLFDGTFDMRFATNTGSLTMDIEYDAVYDGLTLDATGCPVGGGFRVDYDIQLGGEQWNQLPAEARRQYEQQNGGRGRIRLEFGPDCGDVTGEGT